MNAAAIHIGTGGSEAEAWTVGYQIERSLASGGVLALEFEEGTPPTAELFDVLLNKLRDAQSRGTVVEIRNMPAWLRFAFESADGGIPLACAG